VPRIRWIEEDAAEGELADIYETIKTTFPGFVPDILKTMSLRPDFLKAVMGASELHFTDGALSRAQHEMIASYVSAVNRCHY
jgi:alkylhydroperoxidase/carboxymuconolactone decarboxylase family protein YurZ